LVNRHLDELVSLAPDVLPETLRGDGLPSLPEALEAVHRPDSVEHAEQGRRRLAFDELLDLQLMLARARLIAKRGRSGVAFQIRHDLTRGLAQSLPWQLTTDQKRAIREITADMTSPERMHRILMGDVGTGKTVVALFAMLLALENGYQAALMAPTELLAEQHGATLTELLAPLQIRPELLLGRLSNAEKAERRTRLSNGSLRLVVGTHALLQESVSFQRLGLVVIDEQHRFGVEQRAALVAKGTAPDVLLLTATPIPRSLALTRFGDLGRHQDPPAGSWIKTGDAPPNSGAGLPPSARAVVRAPGLRGVAGHRGNRAGRFSGCDHDGRAALEKRSDLVVGLCTVVARRA
jgi:ATP-dependent DNA helicase RecG